ERLFQFFCAPEIMVGKDQVGGAPQTGEISRLEPGGCFQLNVHQMAALISSFAQDVNLGSGRPPELASVGRPAAGGNEQGLGVVFDKSLQLGERQRGLGKVV